jgi:hypothetical protein
VADIYLVHGVEIPKSDGTKVLLHTVRIQDPVPWSENPEGVTEDYYVFQESNGQTALLRVYSRIPLQLEQLDLHTPKGAAYWKRVEAHVAKSNIAFEQGKST